MGLSWAVAVLIVAHLSVVSVQGYSSYYHVRSVSRAMISVNHYETQALLTRSVPFKARRSRISKLRLSSTAAEVQLSSSTRSPLMQAVSAISNALKVLWDFTRPHTILGSFVSCFCLFLYATPASLWSSEIFRSALFASLAPSLLTNLYITGLNQVTDVDIDRVNKPYLPIASGALSLPAGIAVVTVSMLAALLLILPASWPLQSTVLGSALLGTIYSMPPFRLKRFPLLAAFCILVVRGSLVNLGFFLQAKMAVQGAQFSSLKEALLAYPESIYITVFFAIYGLVIALMKDVPDVRGDIQNDIKTFSVRMGAGTMFK